MPQEALILAAPPLDNSAPGKPSRRAWNIESDVKRSCNPPQNVPVCWAAAKKRKKRPLLGLSLSLSLCLAVRTSSDVIVEENSLQRHIYSCTYEHALPNFAKKLRCFFESLSERGVKSREGCFQSWKRWNFSSCQTRPRSGASKYYKSEECFQRYSWSALDASIIHEVLVARPLERASNVREGPRSL